MSQEFDTPATLNAMGSTEITVELEELLETPETTTPSSDLDDMFDLEKLLNESMSRKSDEKRIKEARRSLGNGGITPAERLALQEMVKEWELKREWTPVFDTLMFDVQECTYCGSKHSHFTGAFQQQEHKKSKITRWVASGVRCNLPKNRKENITHVSICSDCADLQGWGDSECCHEQ